MRERIVSANSSRRKFWSVPATSRRNFGGLDDAEIVGAEGPQPTTPKSLVAHHHRIGGAPLVAGEQPGVEVVDVALERRLEAVLPAQDRRQDRDVLGRQRVLAGTEQVGVLAGRDELDQLRLAHDQLRAVLDLLVLVRPAVGERVPRIIGPFDDVDQLAGDDVQQAHGSSCSRVGTGRPKPASFYATTKRAGAVQRGAAARFRRSFTAAQAASSGGAWTRISCAPAASSSRSMR